MNEEKPPTDIAAWFRGIFLQTGATGIICWVFLQQSDKAWELLDANREELRAVEMRAAERSTKQWEEVRRLRETIQELKAEVRRGQ